MSQLRIAFPLATSVAIAPFALDTYLPALPAMAVTYGVSLQFIAMSISIYIFALAVGQLIGGPLADLYGRALIMRIGLALFVLTSLVITQTHDFYTLLAVRAIQAFGGGWVMVCVPALVRDRMQGADAARMFSLIGLMMVAAPAIAPALGAFLLQWQWPAIFFFLAVYGVFVLVTLEFTLFRYHVDSANSISRAQTSGFEQPSAVKRYVEVLMTPSALRHVLIQGLLFSSMMLFVTHASFIYQTHYQVSSRLFSLFFAANIITMWLSMLVNRALLKKYQPLRLLKFAAVIQIIAVNALILVTGLELPLYFYVPALMIAVGMLGATSPNNQACYMEHFQRNGGTAAALMGSLQFGLAGTISWVSTLLPEEMFAIAIAQLMCSLGAVSLLFWPSKFGHRDNENGSLELSRS